MDYKSSWKLSVLAYEVHEKVPPEMLQILEYVADYILLKKFAQ